jgi:hypothetical protein
VSAAAELELPGVRVHTRYFTRKPAKTHTHDWLMTTRRILGALLVGHGCLACRTVNFYDLQIIKPRPATRPDRVRDQVSEDRLMSEVHIVCALCGKTPQAGLIYHYRWLHPDVIRRFTKLFNEVTS